MKVGDLVRIQTGDLNYHEGKYGLIICKIIHVPPNWYKVLIEDQEFCFNEGQLEVINESG